MRNVFSCSLGTRVRTGCKCADLSGNYTTCTASHNNDMGETNFLVELRVLKVWKGTGKVGISEGAQLEVCLQTEMQVCI